MQFSILGPLEVRASGSVLPIGGRKEQAVLALLLVRANQLVSVQKIADELWGEAAPAAAIKTVRSYVSRLRKRLGDRATIVTEGSSYRLDVERGDVDAQRFEMLLDTARDRRAEEAHLPASDQLDLAIRLWRGRALEGLEDHPFAQLESARLHERKLEAIEARIDSDIQLGRHRRLVAELEALVKEHPLREGFWHALMLSLYRSGRQAEALRTYQDARRLLGEELGIEPSPELRRLEEAILLHDEGIVAAETERGPVHNLPEPRDRFIGREAGLAEISLMLEDYRCVTLTGVGGSGKTRLAVESARASIADHPSGIRYVELASLADAGALAERVLLAFGEPGSHSDDAAGALAELIGDGRWLLVLDNCEHLIVAAAELVDRLLDNCPELRILTTSREPLGVGGEALTHVQPLTLPHPDDTTEAVVASEAVRLLADRIQMHHHDFAVTDASREAVIAICRRLDGIPLALELAAARARTLPLADLATKLDDRFGLLTQGSRTAVPRQQTLKATIDWSYDLLSAEARRALRRLGAFAGSWTVESARFVVHEAGHSEAAIVEVVGELVDKSLVELTADGSRYRLLETVRQYAFDESVAKGEAHDAGRRHRDWYLTLAAEADPLLRGPEQRKWWERLEQEHDNLRSAIRWSLDNGQPTKALEMIAALGWFWLMRGYWREAWRWLTRGLEATDDSPARAAAILGVGCIEIVRINVDPVVALLEEAEATYRELEDELGTAWSTYYLGQAAMIRGDDRGMDLADEARAWFDAAGDEWAVAWADYHRAPNDATELVREALETFERLGDLWCASYVRFGLAAVLLEAGEVTQAKETASLGRRLAHDENDTVWEPHATRVLAAAELADGHPNRAHELFEAALQTFRVMGDDACQGTCLSYLSLIEARSGELESAARRLKSSIVRRQRINSQAGLAVCLIVAGALAHAAGDTAEAARLGLRGASWLREADIGASWREIAESLQTDLRLVYTEDDLHRIGTEATALTLDDLSDEATHWCDDFLASIAASHDQ